MPEKYELPNWIKTKDFIYVIKSISLYISSNRFIGFVDYSYSFSEDFIINGKIQNDIYLSFRIDAHHNTVEKKWLQTHGEEITIHAGIISENEFIIKGYEIKNEFKKISQRITSERNSKTFKVLSWLNQK